MHIDGGISIGSTDDISSEVSEEFMICCCRKISSAGRSLFSTAFLYAKAFARCPQKVSQPVKPQIQQAQQHSEQHSKQKGPHFASEAMSVINVTKAMLV